MERYFKEQALTKTECLDKIRAKYGDRAQVIFEKNIRLGGFLGIGAKEGVEMEGVINAESTRYAVPVALPQAAAVGSHAAYPLAPAPGGQAGRQMLDFEEEKKKLLTAAGKNPDLTKLLTEVQKITEKLESTATTITAPEEAYPALGVIRGLLVKNDFSSAYIEKCINRLKKECSLDDLSNQEALCGRVLEWIGDSLRIDAGDEIYKSPRVIVLVGPTGVGKTTTVAKLAACMVLGKSPVAAQRASVSLITIDLYRLAAREQIEKYGELMGVPFSFANDYDELKKAIDLYSVERDVILVDTIGKSPREAMELGKMKELLAACGSAAEVYLVISATTKARDIGEILKTFEPFGYRSVIITKFDETDVVGNVISALDERGKAVAFITDGQGVPDDIKQAEVVRFLINLDGFKINRVKIEKRFSNGRSG